MKRGWIMAAIAAAFLAGTLGAMTDAGASVAAKAVTLVREQNVDANGYVRVHEQGTAKVSVTNDALPVDGTVSIGNTPSVNVANTPTVKVDAASPLPVSGTVSIGNAPTVKLDPAANAVSIATSPASPVHVQEAKKTVLLAGFSSAAIPVAANELKVVAGNVDVSAYEKIRVNVSTSGGSVTIIMSEVVNGSLPNLLDRFDVPANSHVSKTYDVPGEKLVFFVNGGTQPATVWYTAFGR